jgi:DNA-binding transcriptional LysR family regulator
VIGMELRHLNYFVAIAEERSFTRAAERLWIAQPGLSTQIRRLEAELGVKLFDRHTRGVDLTAAGELFLERARAVVAAAELACSTGRDLENGLAGSIRLGVAGEMAWPHASELLASFVSDRPAVELTVVESHGGTLVRDLRDGRLDAVLAPSMFGSPELHPVRLGQEPWQVLAGASHPLAQASGAVAATELEGENVIVTGHRDGHAYDRAVSELLSELGVTPTQIRGGAGSALFASVSAGEAVALTTAPGTPADGVAVRQLDPVRQVDFALLRREETLAPALAGFIDAATTLAEAPHPILRAVA